MGTKMRIRVDGVKPSEINISTSTHEGEPLALMIRFRAGKVARTDEISPEVFADYDKDGQLLSLEFADPESYNVEMMAGISEKLKVPALREINVSRLAPQMAGCE